MLWLLGVEVLPDLHLAGHEADHTHEPDGTIVRTTFGTHAHADGVVHADHIDHEIERDHHRRHGDQLAIDHPAHGAAGIAHRALALHQPATPLLAPLPIARAMLWLEREPNERLTAADAARPAARGPPARG